MITLADREISTIGVIDDDPDARANYRWTAEDALLDARQEDGPLGDLDLYVPAVVARVDAVLCDHHLRRRNYARFDGAQLAYQLYDRGVPTVLCTRFEMADLDGIRKFRKNIPVLIKPDDLEPDILVSALTTAAEELAGKILPGRRLWRTQVHIVEVASNEATPVFYVELPAWSGQDVVRLLQSDLPDILRRGLRDDLRWHARVNIGAEDANDLYFTDWENR